MTNYELVYFELNGRAGGIRLFLDFLQVPFTDTRIPKQDWPTLKPKIKFGQIPVLKILDKGIELPQSVAILRYLATKHGGLGETPEDNAIIDSFADLIQDTIIAVRPWIWSITKNLGEEEQTKQYKETLIPVIKDNFVPPFLKQLKENGSGFLVGKKPTWIDFMLADVVDRVDKIIPPDGKEFIAPLISHRDKVFSLPNLEKRLEDRKQYIF